MAMPFRQKEPATSSKPKSSMSFQMVDLGLPCNGISKYSTKIMNEKEVMLEDRRKTPDAVPKMKLMMKKKHKREASRPKAKRKAMPKPKMSMSLQRVELGIPRGGISKYSTKIINEKMAMLEERRNVHEH